MSKEPSKQQLLRLYKNLDRDGNNEVTRAELETALTRVGWPMERINNLMNQLDMNGDGHITLNEYKLAMGITSEPMGEWERLFKEIDKDGTGKVDKKELRNLFKQMGMDFSIETLDDWIADHDVDGDGLLSYKEFLGFVAEQSDL